ncbi:MAG: ammonium transporter [Moraxellaceae bacterium]|nr:ammonium transporter [Moraxellaceae bacterium]
MALPGGALAAETAPDITEVVLNLNTVWLMVAAALVFLMQAGFALLEGGMARSKNAVNVIMKNNMDVCVGGLIFWVLGFGLMFGANPSGWFGTDWFMPSTGEAWDWSFILFQMMFAATACTIASGAMAERVRYNTYLIGACLITGVIYPVFGAWAWGGYADGTGWLKAMGFIDFAGSTVVHSIGGWCALAGIIVLGPRLGRFGKKGESRQIPGHNLGLVALGGFILWFGWFGFNGGSTTTGDASIGKIILNTHLAACAGAVASALFSWSIGKPVLLTNTVNGSLGGLVGITAGCATMDPQFAVLTGLIAGVITMVGPMLISSAGLDDVVDAVSVHGFCGAWGTLAAGLFFAGDLFDSTRIMVQTIGIAAGLIWGFGTALVMYLVIDLLFGMRASPLHEQRGLDFTEHAEIGYPEFQQNKIFNPDAVDTRS